MSQIFYVYNPLDIESVVSAGAVKHWQNNQEVSGNYPMSMQDFLSSDIDREIKVVWIGVKKTLNGQLKTSSSVVNVFIEKSENKSLLEEVVKHLEPETVLGDNEELSLATAGIGFAAASFYENRTPEALLKKAYSSYLAARQLLLYDTLSNENNLMSYSEGVRRAKLNIDRAVSHAGAKFFTNTDETWPIVVRLLTMAGAKFSLPVSYLNTRAQTSTFYIES